MNFYFFKIFYLTKLPCNSKTFAKILIKCKMQLLQKSTLILVSHNAAILFFNSLMFAGFVFSNSFFIIAQISSIGFRWGFEVGGCSISRMLLYQSQSSPYRLYGMVHYLAETSNLIAHKFCLHLVVSVYSMYQYKHVCS